LSLACTKHSFLVQSLAELPRIMAEAFEVANAGRPGPVLVDIPAALRDQVRRAMSRHNVLLARDISVFFAPVIRHNNTSGACN
ncbi:thiamine pyrophosphate-binding protein, partial [Salmonella enterica subsp. enterica serovar Kentucky]|nr:thiamine pyrophosphate-binding protein [Salmonella enterica subsp. enterica serovar Kentucky]